MPAPRILVVDDELTARLHAQQVLLAAGMRVETSPDGEHAMELLRLRAGTELAFDAVVAGDKMPFMTGWDLMEHVARDHPKLVRVIASGYENALHEIERAHLPHWFVAKPLKGTSLADALRSSLRARDRARP